jgi:hypothetical protein
LPYQVRNSHDPVGPVTERSRQTATFLDPERFLESVDLSLRPVQPLSLPIVGVVDSHMT